MENDLTLLQIISGILAIITLIVFFGMAYNLAKIRYMIAKWLLKQDTKEVLTSKKDDPTQPWKCPMCNKTNPCTTYECEECHYKLQ